MRRSLDIMKFFRGWSTSNIQRFAHRVLLDDVFNKPGTEYEFLDRFSLLNVNQDEVQRKARYRSRYLGDLLAVLRTE